MAEAKVSQLAKLLSAVMECEDVPVEIHNAIADWSCPSTYRVTNSPELFQMIRDDTKAHPEDYGEVPKVSYPVRPGERPKLVLAEKETQQSQPAATGLTLGQHLSAVLDHPDTPAFVYNQIVDGLNELKTNAVSNSAQFIQAVIDGHKREAKQKGGAA